MPTLEAIPAGTKFTMAAGDSAFFPANVAGEVRNDGQEPAVALVATLQPQGVPAGTPWGHADLVTRSLLRASRQVWAHLRPVVMIGQ